MVPRNRPTLLPIPLASVIGVLVERLQGLLAFDHRADEAFVSIHIDALTVRASDG